MKPRVGIVGTGNRGVRTFGALLRARDDVEVVALCDFNAARLQAAAHVLGGDLRLYGELQTMLHSESLDGLVVTTPDYLHAPNTIEALRAGVKHVFVDKPLATTVADCLEVSRVARECGAHVAVGFNLRHHVLIRAIKNLISSGEVGELMLIENREFYEGGRTYHARWNRFRAQSGGLWIHKGSHDFDVFNWWNEAGTPSRVMASAGLNAFRPDKIPFAVGPQPLGPTCGECAYHRVCPDFSVPFAGRELFNDQTRALDGYAPDECVFTSEKDTHDNGIALVEYNNNVRASHMECFVCGFTDRQFTVAGTRGTLAAKLSKPDFIEWQPRWGEAKRIAVAAATSDLEHGHGGADPLLVDSFVLVLRGQSPNGATIRDGLRAVAVGEAAEIASREKRSVSVSELVDLERF